MIKSDSTTRSFRNVTGEERVPKSAPDEEGQGAEEPRIKLAKRWFLERRRITSDLSSGCILMEP